LTFALKEKASQMKLSAIPHQVLLYNVFNYLTVRELIRIYRLNHYWRNTIDSNTRLFLPSINELLNELLSQEMNKSQYLTLVDASVPMSEVFHAFHRPLRLIPVKEYNTELQDAVKKYRDCHGELVHGSFELHPVFDSIFRETGPLEIFHRLAIVLTLYYYGQECKYYFSNEPDPVNIFNFQGAKPIARTINQGQLFQKLLKCDHETVQKIRNISLHMMPVHAQLEELMPDLMTIIHKTPYGLDNLSLDDPVVKIIERDLFDNFEQPAYSWVDESDNWSPFFDAGKEWWGIYAYTMFNKQSNSLVVALASTTD
jgi:hypothetical protein